MRRSYEKILLRISVAAFIATSSSAFAQTSQPGDSGNRAGAAAPLEFRRGETPAGDQKKPAGGAPLVNTTYGDWVLKCQTGGQNAKLCELTQLVVEKEKKTPFAQLAIGRLKPDQPLQVTLVAPTNVTFSSAARIATDEKDATPVDLGWARCLPNACYASAQLRDDILKNWTTKTQPGRALFLNGAGQVTMIPISFKGLGQAIEALGKAK